ncbi:hypothetical protein LMG28690_04293 [Paraburkholderia caffeinilytica]|nr:hypothetical protein LMG28690_04293 [Paraburkholderia caffeinilytica]
MKPSITIACAAMLRFPIAACDAQPQPPGASVTTDHRYVMEIDGTDFGAMLKTPNQCA